MAELRKDYLLERFVIIAKERAKRPHDFKSEKSKNDDSGKCFFCPGNEDKTPEEIQRIGKKNWEMRVFENKFPAVGASGKIELETHNDFYTFSDAIGRHEIIVETPIHSKQLWDLDKEKIKQLLFLYKDRLSYLKSLKQVKYVSVFKNHGKEAGASLKHSHSQIIAYNLIPSEIIQKEEKCKDSCPYCGILEKEKDSERAIINGDFLSFAPYASRFLFEAWIFPKRHVISLLELDEKEIEILAFHIKKILEKLKELNVSYNMYLQEGIKNMHFHVVIAPRVSLWAGFELATDTIINPISPETAAKFYKETG